MVSVSSWPSWRTPHSSVSATGSPSLAHVRCSADATGWPISVYAARHGVDMDLLTRGAGFGYLGSTITSLIYASFTFIFFALEAAILGRGVALAKAALAAAALLCAPAPARAVEKVPIRF